MPFTENLKYFIDTNIFAHAATYTPSGGSATTVNGIFDNEFYSSDIAENGVEGTQPRLTCASADIAGVSSGATFVISGTTYDFVREEPDGTGVSLVILKEA